LAVPIVFNCNRPFVYGVFGIVNKDENRFMPLFSGSVYCPES
jgi:hypothetical protein